MIGHIPELIRLQHHLFMKISLFCCLFFNLQSIDTKKTDAFNCMTISNQGFNQITVMLPKFDVSVITDIDYRLIINVSYRFYIKILIIYDCMKVVC